MRHSVETSRTDRNDAMEDDAVVVAPLGEFGEIVTCLWEGNVSVGQSRDGTMQYTLSVRARCIARG